MRAGAPKWYQSEFYPECAHYSGGFPRSRALARAFGSLVCLLQTASSLTRVVVGLARFHSAVQASLPSDLRWLGIFSCRFAPFPLPSQATVDVQSLASVAMVGFSAFSHCQLGFVVGWLLGPLSPLLRNVVFGFSALSHYRLRVIAGRFLDPPPSPLGLGFVLVGFSDLSHCHLRLILVGFDDCWCWLWLIGLWL